MTSHYGMHFGFQKTFSKQNYVNKLLATNPFQKCITCVCTRAETRQCGPPPKIIFRGPLKYFFLDGDAKERAPTGRCQARGVWGHAPPENFAEFDLILEAFCAF